jgi:hypothetical protein
VPVDNAPVAASTPEDRIAAAAEAQLVMMHNQFALTRELFREVRRLRSDFRAVVSTPRSRSATAANALSTMATISLPSTVFRGSPTTTTTTASSPVRPRCGMCAVFRWLCSGWWFALRTRWWLPWFPVLRPPCG